MKSNRTVIKNIPVVIWGGESDKAYIYVHGKMSCKEYAEGFAEIAEKKGYQTISFDLPEHGERKNEKYRCDIWNGMNDLKEIGDFAFAKWNEVSLFACSLGAYFSLNAYKDRAFANCLFQSPILNMEYLIRQMFIWFGVDEERLYAEKEIPTPIELLSWDYYQYVKGHPVEKWNIPTKILYAGRDNLQSIEIIEQFVKAYECRLTISKNSEHPFMDSGDEKIVNTWIEENI